MVNKDLLISKVSQKTGYTKGDIRVVVDTVFKTIIDEVSKNEQVSISGFGKFEAVERAARDGVNPRTGETMHIDAVTIPHFRAGSVFKEAVR